MVSPVLGYKECHINMFVLYLQENGRSSHIHCVMKHLNSMRCHSA
jgi:hypothetical protein